MPPQFQYQIDPAITAALSFYAGEGKVANDVMQQRQRDEQERFMLQQRAQIEAQQQQEQVRLQAERDRQHFEQQIGAAAKLAEIQNRQKLDLMTEEGKRGLAKFDQTEAAVEQYKDSLHPGQYQQIKSNLVQERLAFMAGVKLKPQPSSPQEEWARRSVTLPDGRIAIQKTDGNFDVEAPVKPATGKTAEDPLKRLKRIRKALTYQDLDTNEWHYPSDDEVFAVAEAERKAELSLANGLVKRQEADAATVSPQAQPQAKGAQGPTAPDAINRAKQIGQPQQPVKPATAKDVIEAAKRGRDISASLSVPQEVLMTLPPGAGRLVYAAATNPVEMKKEMAKQLEKMTREEIVHAVRAVKRLKDNGVGVAQLMYRRGLVDLANDALTRKKDLNDASLAEAPFAGVTSSL